MTLLFYKAKAAAPGEIRHRKDGRDWRKIGTKWARVPAVHKVVLNDLQEAEHHFNYSMVTNMGNVVADVLSRHGVTDFNSLVSKLKNGPPETAHKIYKDMYDTINTSPGTHEDRQAALHLIGHALVKVKAIHVESTRAKMQVKVTSKTGKEYYRSQVGVTGKTGRGDVISTELPLLKPTAVAVAKKRVGGWTVTGALETPHVRAMLANGTAKLVYGKLSAKKAWTMPVKAEDMHLRYLGDSLLLRVKQSNKTRYRTSATAKVEIKLPYAFAKAFLMHHIKSVRTRNNFIFRMENSKGYAAFLDKAGAK